MSASQSQSTPALNSGSKPRFINDWKNLSDKIQFMYRCERDTKWLGLYTHTDSLFSTGTYLFGISFHKDVHRFDFGKLLVNQKEFNGIYERCYQYKINRDFCMWDVLKIAGKVGEEPYGFLLNNCNDSSRKLINQLLKPA